jgi:hypothetical protein
MALHHEVSSVGRVVAEGRGASDGAAAGDRDQGAMKWAQKIDILNKT